MAQRYISDAPPTPAEFEAAAKRFGRPIGRFRKIAPVGARRARRRQTVETRWDGRETNNVAAPGDWIVTALTPAGAPLKDSAGALNRYVLSPERFAALYRRGRGSGAYGAVFRPVGEVRAFYLAGGFDIEAPWGARQRAARGYLLRNGDEVYGNHADTFVATYRRLRR